MGLGFIDKMKRQLELAADTDNVRLSQTRDHLIWKEPYQDDDGEVYDQIAHIYFLSDEECTVLEIYPDHYFWYDGHDDNRIKVFEDGIDEFFSDVKRRRT